MAGVLVHESDGYWWVLVGIGGIGGKFETKNADEEFPKRGIEAGGVNAI